jgi:hypothetical protein
MPFKPRRNKASVMIDKYPKPDVDELDVILAAKFKYNIQDPFRFCAENAAAADLCGRQDYRRLLEFISSLLKGSNVRNVLWGEHSDHVHESAPNSISIKRGLQMM